MTAGMMNGLRVAALFAAYGALGAGGDYAASLLAQDASPQARVEPELHIEVDVDIEPDIQVDVQVRHTNQCAFEVDREYSLPTSLENQLVIEAGSGELDVEGRQGVSELQVFARLCASHEEYLEEMRVMTFQRDQQIVLNTIYPDQRNRWNGENKAQIHLRIVMPLGMSVDIDDSSGSMTVYGSGDLRIDDSSGSITVSGANGNVYIDDSSGGIEVGDVAGDLEIKDGSGGIDVRDVQGSVRLDDGSGGIDVAEVDQSVYIDDGSGSIDVRSVGGDLVVEDDGSGSIRHSDVLGVVNVPEDKRRRRRRPRG